MPKLQNNEKNIDNYELIIIFIPKFESLPANSIFPNLL